jgi:cell division protein FtsQ
VTTSDRFAIAEIQIRGNHHLTTEQIRTALPVTVGDNVFAADLDTVTRQLRTNPWIASVDAHRILPHTIVIELREHVPAALAELGGLYLVDSSGHPFTRLDDDGERSGLPVITGLARASYLADPDATAKLIASSLDALAQWNTGANRPAIGEVHVGPDAQLVLYTFEHATAIHLGAVDSAHSTLGAHLATFDVAWAELGESERARARALHLDIRSDHVTVAF